MTGRKAYLYPVIFVLVLVPFVIAAFVLFRPDSSDDTCGDQALLPSIAPHSHGVGLATTVRGDMQLIFNVSAGAELYQLVDGSLELCSGDLTGNMKHITVDVNDAAMMLGERLPVAVDLEVRRAGTQDVVVQAAAPAMYAPGHGYHFGDNFLLEPDAAYDWTVTISPVRALRQDGAQHVWLEPVIWEGSFALGPEGEVLDKEAAPNLIGDISRDGVHITLSESDPVALYAVEEGASVPQEMARDARYFLVDLTDHAVNYEEKLPGATVTLFFRQGADVQEVPLDPVISPLYGFHYGANVALAPGVWNVTVEVEGLDMLRHAGAAVSFGTRPVTASFEVTIPAADDAGTM